jgi:hypothetical protein
MTIDSINTSLKSYCLRTYIFLAFCSFFLIFISGCGNLSLPALNKDICASSYRIEKKDGYFIYRATLKENNELLSGDSYPECQKLLTISYQDWQENKSSNKVNIYFIRYDNTPISKYIKCKKPHINLLLDHTTKMENIYNYFSDIGTVCSPTAGDVSPMLRFFMKDDKLFHGIVLFRTDRFVLSDMFEFIYRDEFAFAWGKEIDGNKDALYCMSNRIEEEFGFDYIKKCLSSLN